MNLQEAQKYRELLSYLEDYDDPDAWCTLFEEFVDYMSPKELKVLKARARKVCDAEFLRITLPDVFGEDE